MRHIQYSARVFVLLLGLLLTMPGTPGMAAPPLKLPPVKAATLRGGFKVQLVQRRELPLVSLELMLKAGSAADPAGQAGIARFTGELLKAGAGKLSAQALAETVDTMGATLDITVRRDATYIALEVLSKDLGPGIDLLADLVLRPTFDSSEIERTRRRTLAALQELQDEPSSAASVAFMRQLYGDHPYGHPTLGNQAAIESLTRDQVVAFHRGIYRPERATLTVVGDFEGRDAKRLLKRAFGGWSRALKGSPALKVTLPTPPIPIQGRRVVLVHRPKLTQAQIRIGNIGVAAGMEGDAALEVANTELGGGFTSRLNEEIRVNRSLSYGAYSGFARWQQPGPFTINTFTKNETTGETIQVALDTLSRFRKEGLSQENLIKSRNYAIGRFALQVETIDALAHKLNWLDLHGLPLQTLTQRPVHLGEVREADIAQALERFPEENLLILVYCDKDQVGEQLEAFGEPIILDP